MEVEDPSLWLYEQCMGIKQAEDEYNAVLPETFLMAQQ